MGYLNENYVRMCLKHWGKNGDLKPSGIKNDLATL